MSRIPKFFFNTFFPASWRRTIFLLARLSSRLDSFDRKLRNVSQATLSREFPTVIAPDSFKDEINWHGFKIFSQNNEDGILLHIFSEIGVTNYRFVEFGVQEGWQCNTANLSLNFGWSGLLMDANADDVEAAKRFYRDTLGPKTDRVRIIQCFVTAENINEMLATSGASGEIDLLSIDIDGNDYWVWKAITVVEPRVVVVVEYNALFGNTRSVTIPYRPQFEAQGLYFGASLAALTKLAQSKGYVLVGCDSNGVNAFFVRRDAMKDGLREVPIGDAFYLNARYAARGITQRQIDLLNNMPVEDV